MKIFITTPDFSLHGGIRIILEWANRLADLHEVFLYSLKGGQCNWFPISEKVNQVKDDSVLKHTDAIIITSPHSIHYEDKPYPKKKFVFMQMCEDMFRPGDQKWQQLCKKFYLSPNLICISRWNIQRLEKIYGRKRSVFYIGNGVNLEHFPIVDDLIKDNKTILVEGWESGNPSKDPDHLGPRVAYRLKKLGYKILAYSGQSLKTLANVPDEYHYKPSLRQMNELYERATILIKASRYDARSCAPMEAMTKGTVTARAIIQGDDDLHDNFNCIRTAYAEMPLYLASVGLLRDENMRKKLAWNGINHVKEYSWKHWLPIINSILCSD